MYKSSIKLINFDFYVLDELISSINLASSGVLSTFSALEFWI
jgi:hypothetical protein